MNAPLRIAPATPPQTPPSDAISTWLETLAVLLKMPSAKRDEIRDELDSHLRERVRDLMLTGQTEPDAVRTAIGELGDAVKLAQRLRAAGRNPRRRLMMNLAVVGVAGVALLTSVLSLNAGSPPAKQPETKRPPAEVATAFSPRSPQDAKLLKITVEPNLPMAEFFTQISKSSGMPVVVRWKQLDAIGACAAVPPDVDIQEAPLREAFDLINEALGMQHDGLDFRIADNRLTIATISYFDKNETVLVAYDLQQQAQDRARQLESKSLAEATRRVTEEVSHVIQELVQKDLWVDNGGDRASIAVYGSKLFVRAPKRFHPEIEWVISQLPITQDLAEVPLITGANLVLIRPEIVEPDMLDPSKIIDPVKVVIPTLPMEASPKK